MNLPVVIDIAIGLIFIYLILSLLTSEIQELVAILLQWRAEHLKRSIENLITGANIDDPLYQKFTDELYSSPLIKALNQEAKGLLAGYCRGFIQFFTAIYYKTFHTQSTFRDQKSAPSYIPAETFSVALLQQVNFKEFSQKVGEITAQKFSDEKLIQLRTALNELAPLLGDEELTGENSLLEKEYRSLQQGLKMTLDEFLSGRSTLTSSLDQISDQLVLFIDNMDLLPTQEHQKEIIRTRMSYLKRSITRRQSEPTVTEILRLIFDQDSEHPSGVKVTPWIREILTTLKHENPELFHQVSQLPEQLQLNLLSLAEQARLKTKSLHEEVKQLEQEVADWFNHSMERASGVYKRNAKGIAILIGFLLAIAINADTFYMVSRLSKDTTIRATIGAAADHVVLNASSPSSSSTADRQGNLQANLEEVKTAVNTVLDEMPLPLGWNQTVLEEQIASEKKGWLLPVPQRAIGWFITGIALSMGSSFWYDLLGRFVRVRGVGDKPKE